MNRKLILDVGCLALILANHILPTFCIECQTLFEAVKKVLKI